MSSSLDWTAQAREKVGREKRVLVIDFAVTVPLLALVMCEIWATGLFGEMTDHQELATVFGIAAILPLGLRRVAPLGSLVVIMAMPLVSGIFVSDFKPFTLFLAWIISVYSVAAHEPNDRALWGIIVALLATGILGAMGGFDDDSGVISVWIFLGAAWGVGRAMRTRETAAARLASEATQLEAERDAQAERAVSEERTRIARELHDVVAHGVSVMVVQAGAAQRVIAREPERARESLSSIENAGRQALVELRRLLGVLRADDGQSQIEPQPGLGQVGQLIEGARDAGLQADLRIVGEPSTLSAGTDLAAYRIVQEALTNVIKHASASRVDVVLRYSHPTLELEVADNGGGPPMNGRTAGHGLVGMRERAAMFGGTISLTAGENGGAVLRACIPLVGEGT
jgi:signal transduction histidine kinase